MSQRLLIVEDDLSVVAAVGEGMRERPGVAGQIFRVLGSEGVNVRAIAQNSADKHHDGRRGRGRPG